VQDHYISQLKSTLAQMLEKDEKRLYFAFLTHTTKELVTEEEKTSTNSIRKKRKHKNLFVVEIPEEEFYMDLDVKLEIDVQFTKRSTNYFGQVTRKNCTFIRTIAMKKNSNAKQVYLQLFKFLRFLFNENWPENDRESFTKLDDETAFTKVFESVEKKPFQIRLVTNTRGFQECFFCGDRRCDNCELAYDENVVIDRDILPKIKDSDFKLELEVYFENMPDWVELARLNSCVDYAKNVKGKDAGSPGVEETKKEKEASSVNIYDCLGQFAVPEQLGEDNQWYCSECKDFKKATKKMEIYKAPPILMIQLKRFKHTNSLLSKSKIGDKIDFPLENLDLTNYVINPELPMDYNDLPTVEEQKAPTPSQPEGQSEVTVEVSAIDASSLSTADNTQMEIESTKEETKMQVETLDPKNDQDDAMKNEDSSNPGSPALKQKNNNLLYDLFAVSNHYGSLGFGHYTAYCKNFKSGKWHCFDDSSVSTEDPDNVCSTGSYVLFYKRKDFSLN